MTIEIFAAITISVAACVTDLRSRRIPNWLTFGAAAAGITWHLVQAGPGAALWSLAGWLACVALFAPVFIVGGMGAGDVKLVGALGAWLGVSHGIYLILYSAICGGVMAVAVSLARGYFRTALANLRLIVTSWRFGIAMVPGLTLGDARGPRLAYALPIAAGTVLTVWLRG